MERPLPPDLRTVLPRHDPVLSACIFDVDGVLLASPHERAWREALESAAQQDQLTTVMYQTHVAGKPRLDGAIAALRALGVPDAERHAAAYAERKQQRLEALIRDGSITAFPDGLRLVRALRTRRWRLAAASSSKNANEMMRHVQFDSGETLLDVFTANVCGRDVLRGKPHPDLFLLAAAELGVAPSECVVIEDAPAGVAAARAANMTAIGIARLEDAASLKSAGADLVVTNLDDVSLDALAVGQLASLEGAAWNRR